MTRTEPGASATSARLTKLGLAPLKAPLLSIEPLKARLILEPQDALAFTSLAGVNRTCDLIASRDHVVFAVGDATAEAALAAGFKKVRSASGNVSALAALILADKSIQRVVHPSAEETAGDLVGSLLVDGVSAIAVPVYRTSSETALPKGVAEAMANGRLQAVLIHSPKAGRIAASLLHESGADLSAVALVGLSQACLDPFTSLAPLRSACAAGPNEEDLLAALVKALRP